MAKRKPFDIESFTNLLRCEFYNDISSCEVEEIENLWYTDKIGKAFSKAASIYHRLPKHKITEDLRHGVQAFLDATVDTSPRYISGKRFYSERYTRSPTPQRKYFEPERYKGSPPSLNRKKKNTEDELVYYIKVLARGIHDENSDDIEVVQNLDGMNKGIPDLRGMAYDVDKLFQQIDELEEKTRNNNSLWDTAVEGLSKERDVWKDRFQKLEEKYISLVSSYMIKVDTITQLETETISVNERLRDTQHKLQAKEKCSAALLQKYRQLSESFDNVQYQNRNLEERIRTYTTTVEHLENEIGTLKKKNSLIKNQTDARNTLLKRATVHGETMGIYDKEIYEREMPATKETSVSLQERVEELEAKCRNLGERNSSLINQVQAKKIQLKKATKHSEATNTESDELQDRLKEAEQRIKQIEQEKRELEEKCIILNETYRPSGRSRSTSSHTGELGKVQAENDDLRARLLFQESIGNQNKFQGKGHKLSKENDRSPNNLTSSNKRVRVQTTQEPADQILLYKDEIIRLKERITELEQDRARHAEHGTVDISFRDRVTKHKVGGQDQTDFRIKQLEKENNDLKSRLQTAIDLINQPEKTESRRKGLVIDGIGVTNRRPEDGDELGLSAQPDSKIKELELRNDSLNKRLQDALDRNKETERGEIRLEEHGTDGSGFTDRFSGTRDQTIQLEKVQSKLAEMENEKGNLEERLKEALAKINQMENDDKKKNETGTGNVSLKDRLQNSVGKGPQSEVSESRTRELERDISSLHDRLRDANDKINQLERDNSRLNDTIASGNPTLKERFQYAFHRSPSDVSSSQVRELERENRSLENRLEEAMNRIHELDREVQKGSKDSYKSHSGKNKRKIREKSDARVKDLERENISLQDSTSKLRKDMGEKDQELRRVTSQLQKAENDKRDLLMRMKRGSEDSNVLQGSGAHFTSPQSIAMRNGEGLTEIHREKEKVLQVVNQAKQFEQQNQQLLESQSRLQSQLEEKDQELERLHLELRSHGARNTDQDQDLTFIKPEKEGMLHTESQTRQLEQDKRDLTERNEQLKSQLEQHQREVERLQTELRQRDENRTEQSMTDMHHQTGGESLTERQIERFEQQKENLLDRNRDLQKQIDQLREEVSRLTREHQQKDDYCTELSKKLTDMRRERDMAGQNDGQSRQLEQEKQELQQRLGQEQAEEQAGIYSEGAPSKLKKAKKIKTYSGEKMYKDKGHRIEDGEQNELDRVKLELLETKQENEDLKKRLNEGVGHAIDLQKINELEAHATKIHSEKRELEEKNQRLGRESVYGQEDMQKVQSELQKAEENNKNLQERLTLIEQEAEKSQQQENTARKLRRERQELQNRLSDSENTATRLRKERQELRYRNVELEQKNTQSRNELERLSSDLRQSEERNANLSRRLRNADGDSEKVKELEVQVLYLQNEKKQGEERLKRVERETTKREKLETRPKLYGEEKGSLPDQSPCLQEQLEKQQMEIARITSELHQTKTEKEELEHRLQRLEREKSTTESAVTTFRQYEKERGDMGKSNVQLQKQIEEQQTDIQRLNSDLKKSQEESHNLRDRLNVAEKMPKKVEELEVQLIYLLNEKKEAEKRTSRLQRKVEQQQAEIQRLHLQLEQVQEQYDDIQTRFSQLASAQLTHDNPNVTDLSDSNRPIKLGDAYSELYDNEWTEAYSALDEDDGNSLQEVEIVMTLRDILLDCFEHCKDTSKKQIDGIKSLLFSPRATSSTVPSGADLTKAQAKMISELRKKTVAQAISSMQQKMTRKYHDRWQYKAVEDFVKKCVELCWPMVVQSPPVFLDGGYKSGDHFDKDVFKAFTKTGTSIDYVVWPPLYLHKGGPILCKGTAQGRK